MKRNDWLTIWSTALIGFCAGAYVYVVGFAPQLAQVTAVIVPPPDLLKMITIEGRQYGGCERLQQCASFQVRDDGEYSYITTSRPTNVGPIVGVISRRDWAVVRSTLSAEILQSFSKPVTREQCASFLDLIDYRYVVRFAGQDYILDTCTTAIERDSVLGRQLDWLWEYIVYDSTR